MKIRIDCHIHSEKSFDGRLKIEQIIKTAKHRHLDAIAICDHDVANLQGEEGDLLVIPGVELNTRYGHILGLFIEREPAGDDDLERIKSISDCGGIAVLAHPYEKSKTDQTFKEIMPYIFGVEIFNARADRKVKCANKLARELAKEKSLPVFVGSDAHIRDEIGGAYMVVDAKEKTLPAIRDALIANNICEIYGKDAVFAYTAASQWTRFCKRDKGLLNKFKWLFFALGCLFTDVFHIKKTYHKKYTE